MKKKLKSYNFDFVKYLLTYEIIERYFLFKVAKIKTI